MCLRIEWMKYKKKLLMYHYSLILGFPLLLSTAYSISLFDPKVDCYTIPCGIKFALCTNLHVNMEFSWRTFVTFVFLQMSTLRFLLFNLVYHTIVTIFIKFFDVDDLLTNNCNKLLNILNSTIFIKLSTVSAISKARRVNS